jgi:hypothetical protein
MHFSINGDFIWPLTVPHLPVNAPCRGAVAGVCLMPGSALKIVYIMAVSVSLALFNRIIYNILQMIGAGKCFSGRTLGAVFTLVSRG